jgi:hypothetical protein
MCDELHVSVLLHFGSWWFLILPATVQISGAKQDHVTGSWDFQWSSVIAQSVSDSCVKLNHTAYNNQP